MEQKQTMTRRLDDLQTHNLFIYQDPQKYCFTSDAVHLANFVSAPKNAKVVDLCSGSGVIGMLVCVKNPVDIVKMVEIQEDIAQMSMDSVKYNNLQDKIEVINSPLQNVYKLIGQEKYDVVVCNPPYKKSQMSMLSENDSIKIAKHEIKMVLEDVFVEASKLLKFGGSLYLINKEERLSDMICFGRKYNLEAKQVVVIESKKGANVVMLKCVKGGKSGIVLSRIDADKKYC